MSEVRTAENGVAAALLIAVGVVAIAAAVAIGGVHASVQIGLAASCLLLLLAYALSRGSRGLRPVPFLGAALVAVGFTFAQLVPLPAPLVGWFSPLARGLREEAGAGFLMPLTLDVSATWLALARVLACTALLLLVGSLVERRGQARRLLLLLAGGCTLVAVIALVQRLLGVQTILGFYKPQSNPGFGVFGTFVDVNHTAALLTLGTLIAAGLALELRGPGRVAAWMAAAVMVMAVMVSTSRSGAFGLAVGAFVFVAIIASRSLGVARALGAAFIVLLVAASAVLWTNEALRARLWGAERLLANQKTRGWAAGAEMAVDYKWTGVGRGAFEAPVNAYRPNDEGVRLVYPENVVVQLASEWGLPVTLLVAALALAAARRCTPSLVTEASPAVVGAASGVVAVLFHDLADFSLELPGVAFPTTVALGVVVGRLGALQRRKSKRGWRIGSAAWWPLWGAAALSVVAAARASVHTLDADSRRLQAQRGAVDEVELRATIARHPADDYVELTAAQAALRTNPAQALHHVNRALRLHPANWQAHRLAARALLALGRPSQAALEYRLALATGMPFDLPELTRMLSGHVVEAVPQTPLKLTELARSLYAGGHAAEADAAAQRAVELAHTRVPQLMLRVQLALEANGPAMAAASRALLAEADSVEAFALAARGFSRAGLADESNHAIEAGLKAHAGSAALLLVGAELHLAGGDVTGARAMLGRSGKAALTLAERQHAEELLGDIDERAGDLEGATLARARARLIAKKRQAMTFSGD